MLVAEAPQRLGELSVQGEKTAFALHRLDDEARHVVYVDFNAEQTLHSLQRFGAGHAVIGTGVGQVIHRAGQYTDLLLVGRDLAVEVEGRQSAPVESAVKGDHRRAPGGTTGDLQGVFGRLGAAVGEHAADRVFHRDKSAETLHQLDVGRMRCGVERVMGEPGGLLAYGRHHGRVAMAQVEYADTADKVDITFTRRVPDFCVFTVAQADGVND